MKDVANLAKVSVSTVSRVLSGKIPVDDTTRSRVEQAVASLDYRPNLLATGLRNRSGRFIGFVVPSMAEPFASMVTFLEREARNAGYSLLLGNSDGDAKTEKLFLESLIRRHADGVIFSVVSGNAAYIKSLVRSDIPMVMFDRVSPAHNGLISVALDNRNAGRLAASLLLEFGHRRIAVVEGPANLKLSQDRTEGFREGLVTHGVALDDEDLYSGDFSFSSGVKAARRMLKRGIAGLTAVWAQNDLMAIGITRELHGHGVRVPEDLSVMGMDDIPPAEMLIPSLTTVRQPLQKMCRRAVQSIVLQEPAETGSQPDFVFQSELVVRESVRNIG